MRLFYSTVGDPMLLDSQLELHALHSQFRSFLASAAPKASFEAETNGSPAPYDEFLLGLRVQKNTNEPHLSISADRWLELCGPLHELERFNQKLVFSEPNGHAHWYSKPVSLIIEADDTWEGQHES